MPEIRLAHTANELNGKIYIVGGMNTEQGQLPTTALVYDRSLGTWTTIPLLNNEFRTAHTSRVANGKLYVIGGWTTDGPNYVTSSKVDMFDPNTGLWTSKNPMLTHRANIASALIDGKIYVMGGLSTVGGVVNYTGLKTMEVYDVSTDTWDTTKADMPTGRWGLSAVAFNGKIYVFGGVTFESVTTVYASVEVYDPQTNIWMVTSHNMPTPRYQLTTCVLNDNVYAIGGWYHSNYGPIYDKVEVYNPESDTWYTETPIPIASALLASIFLDGKIQIYGGSITTHPLIGSSGIYEFSNNDPLPAGTYTIGSGGYFSSIQSAFDKLSTDGVSGAVTLELIDDLYTAPTDSFGFHLEGPIPGSGPNSRVIIKPAANKNVIIEGDGRSVVSFLNTSYVTVDGVGLTGATTLTIHALFNAQFQLNSGVDFFNNSDHNVIQNVNVISEDYTRDGESIGFLTQSGFTTTADSNLIQNNFIKKAGIAIFIGSLNPSVNANGNIIRGNFVGSETDSLIAWGIQSQYTQNTIIENNNVQNVRYLNNYFSIGINSYVSNGDVIRNNVVHNIYTSGGIYGGIGIMLSGDPGVIGNNNLVYNNMVYDIRSSSSQSGSIVAGIQVWYQNNPKIYYNSVNLSGSGNGANPDGSAALYISSEVTNLDAKNNILVNTRDESPYYASVIFDYSASNLTSDYNDLYANNYLVRIGNTNYNTLADWQAMGKDLNSVTEMSNFISPYLHIAENEETLLESRGIPIAAIDVDFDGQTRHAATPDIGADEFNGIVVGVEDEETLPTEYALEQNYPNPFNPSTTFRYSIPTQSKVLIKVYDVLGNEIATLINEEKSVGTYELTWNAEQLPSGVYFYQLKAGEFSSTKKMLLIK